MNTEHRIQNDEVRNMDIPVPVQECIFTSEHAFLVAGISIGIVIYICFLEYKGTYLLVF